MATPKQPAHMSTILSSKGQVIIPKSVRAARRWEAGLVFDVVEMDDGIMLKPSAPFVPSELASVAGMLKNVISPKTDEEIAQAMDSSIRSEWVDRS